MLDSLYIKNFRLFKELKIEQLGRVNLIIGRNNSGKTGLLEALHLYAKNASPRTLYELIMERGEDWEIRKQQNDEASLQEIENPLRHLFYGYHFPEKLEDNNAIEMGSLKTIQDRLKLQVYEYQTIDDENAQRFTRVNQTQLFDIENTDIENTELVIEIEIANQIKSRVRLNDIETPKRRIFPYRLSSNEAKLNVQVVPTKSINNSKVATLWDNINVQPALRKEVFKLMVR
jgi:AAA15 family ATPase/GTPase